MCGRYTLLTKADALAEFFQLPREIFASLEPRYNIAPTQAVLAIRDQRADFMPWGLVRGWGANGKSNAVLINARSETLAQKSAFRRLFIQRRCVIPASGFYEWQQNGRAKQPFYIKPAHGGFFAFAGLWDVCNGPDGESAQSCAIITTQPNTLMEPFHDRMPAVLQKKDIQQWLDPSSDIEKLKPLLMPFPADEMQAEPVSDFVNSARNEGPRCLEPFIPEPTLFG